LTYRIRENSLWAWLAAKRLKSEKMAMVLGRTIHLHNTTAEELLQNRRWLRHELAHIRQVQELGSFRFLWLYTLESFRNGYRQNRFEVEARAAEADPSLDSFVFQPSSRQAARQV
jgi:hypothetical protein